MNCLNKVTFDCIFNHWRLRVALISLRCQNLWLDKLDFLFSLRVSIANMDGKTDICHVLNFACCFMYIFIQFIYLLFYIFILFLLLRLFLLYN